MKKHFSVLLATEWTDPRLQKGVARFAREAGWHIFLDAIYDKHLPWGWKGDGCITMIKEGQTADFVQSLDVPIVDITHQVELEGVPRVHEDDSAIGKLAAEHLLAQGFKNFAFFSIDNHNVATTRCDSFEAEVTAQGYTCTGISWQPSKKKQHTWKERRKWLISEIKKADKPLAVFCVDDRLAVNLAEVATDIGLNVPDQIAVMGVGDLEIACECSAVPITSIAIDYETLGYQAAEMLHTLMSKKDLSEKHVLVPPSGIVLRKSTESFGIADPLAARVVRYMFDNYQENIGINDIVRAIDVKNRRQLTYLIKKELGVGPAGVLEQIRLRKAVLMLQETDLSINQIAEQTGFGTALRFQRVFSRNYKTSPGRYRKIHTAKR